MTSWSKDEDTFIRANYGRLTAHECALRLPGRTRGMVIGRASRLGQKSDLIGGRSIGIPRPRGDPKPPRKVLQVQPQRHSHTVRKITLAKTSVNERMGGQGLFKQVTLVDDIPLDLPNLWCEPVSLVDLERHHCRWPMDGGKYCGLPKDDNSSYCASHHHASVNHEHRYKRGVWVSPKL